MGKTNRPIQSVSPEILITNNAVGELGEVENEKEIDRKCLTNGLGEKSVRSSFSFKDVSNS